MSENETKPDAGGNAAAAKGASAVAPEVPDLGNAAQAPADNNVASLRAEVAAAKNRELRALAELDNYRKRASRDAQEQLRYAQLPLMRDVLPVLDNVRRAIEAAEKTHDTAALLEGIKLVAQQLEDALRRHHCVPIPALHTPFDPNVHEAILQQPSAEVPANTVLQEVRSGYLLFDRVVRPSQVIVSKGKEEGGGVKDEG